MSMKRNHALIYGKLGFFKLMIISFSKEDARDIDQFFHDAGCDNMAFAVLLNDDAKLALIGTLN